MSTPTPPFAQSSTEQLLCHAGFHPAGAWWCDIIDAFDASDALSFWLRVGRRGGKSVHALRWLIREAIEKSWPIDPGDVGIIPIISARRSQALDRIATTRKYLEALIPEALSKPRIDRIDFKTDWGRCSIRAYSATAGDVVSGTYIAVLLDEVSRWIDDRGRNPASEVIASVMPGLLSTGGKMWGISSPMGIDDAHAKRFALGDTAGQMVAFAPTWIANAELYTKAMCLAMEPDELLFNREYGAIPMAGHSAHWLNGLLLDRALGELVTAPTIVTAGGDLGFTRDACGLVVCESDLLRTSIRHCAEWRPIDEPLMPTATINEALALTLEHGAGAIMTDQWARANMLEATRAHGVAYRNKPGDGAHWQHARRALNDNTVALPSCSRNCACGDGGVCDRLVKQLHRVRVVPHGNHLRYEHDREDGAHGDLAEAWALALWQTRGANRMHGETLGAPSPWGQR